MEDGENGLHASKKRVAGRQISKDDPSLDDDDDITESEMGTFKRASDEVLASRRMIKVKRQQPPPATSSNPFAALRLVTPTDLGTKTDNVTVQPQSPDVKAGDSEEAREGKGTESKKLVTEENGTGDDEKPDNVAESSASDAAGKVKSKAIEEANHPIEYGKDLESEGGKTDSESKRTDTDTEVERVDEDVKETSKEAGEETERTIVEQAGKGDEGETGTEKQGGGHEEKSEPVAPLSSFQQLSSSQNAFTGLSGTGFSSSSFSFGTIPKDGSAFGGNSGPLFGFNSEKSVYPSFAVGPVRNSNSEATSFQLFGSAAPTAAKSSTSGITSMQDVPIETGEENEKAMFTADAISYEYVDGVWKERGKGELKVNVSTSGAEKARLIMRTKGNFRLILNASLYADMSLTNMDKKGITFACVNSAADGKSGLATFALKFKDSLTVEEFRRVVTEHKGKKSTVLKTPENSPKISDD